MTAHGKAATVQFLPWVLDPLSGSPEPATLKPETPTTAGGTYPMHSFIALRDIRLTLTAGHERRKINS